MSLRTLMASVVTFLLLTLALGNGEPHLDSYGIPTNCSSVCGVSEKLNQKDLVLRSPLLNIAPQLKNTTCTKDRYQQWTSSTSKFLGDLGQRERKFGCTRWQHTERPPNSNHLPKPLADSIDLLGKKFVLKDKVQVRNPRSVSGICHVKIGRGLLRRATSRNIVTDWLFSSTVSRGESVTVSGSAFFIFETKARDARSYRVPRNASDRCVSDGCGNFKILWLRAPVFRTPGTSPTAPGRKGEVLPSRRFLSIFTNWTAEQLPGMNKLLDRLSEGADVMKNIDNDLSTSNLAILCLPLIMSIPPISLLESVSTSATLWYTFATDFLAALPLLIKGIEIIVAYDGATASMVSTISMMGEKYGIFERWFVECLPLSDKFSWLGPGLVGVASWFIVASTYVEFLFWRRAQYKRGELKEKISETEESFVEELPDRATKMPIDSDTSPGHRVHFRRTRFVSLVLIFIAAATGLTLCQSLNRASNIGCIATDVAFSILVVSLRVLIWRRISLFAHCNFLAGILLGLICGPLYLVLHAFGNVRKSEKWAEISDGAHIGFASLAMIWSLVIDLAIFDTRSRFVTGSAIFMIVFGISISILHFVRSEGRDVEMRGYAAHGLALGLLFGPFGLLFKRCFPEGQLRKNEIEQTLLSGTAYGMLFVCILIPNIIGNINRL